VAQGVADPNRTLTTAHEAHSLSASESRKAFPVRLKGVITYYDPYIDPRHAIFFFHDSTGSIFVALKSPITQPVHAGTLVEVSGVSGPGDFAPIVERADVKILGESQIPKPGPLFGLSHLLTGAEDGQWIQIEGVVQTVWKFNHNVYLDVSTNEGVIVAFSITEPGVSYESLVDAKVRIRGNDSPLFNRLRQRTGTRVVFSSIDMVLVEQAAPTHPFDQPIQDIGNLLRFEPNIAFRHRAHIRGRVTNYWPGRTICIQDATDGLCAETVGTKPIRTGEVADVVGFPVAGDFKPTLTNSIFRSTGQTVQETASLVTAEEAIKGDRESRLIQIEGTLIGRDCTAS